MENNIEKANNERRNQIKKNADSYKASTRKTGYSTLKNTDLGNNYEECVCIVALITKDGEFIANQRGDTSVWDISINPNYSLSESVKKTNTVQKISIALTITILVFGIYIQWNQKEISSKQYDLQKKQDSLQKEQQKIQTIEAIYQRAKIDSIQKRLDDMQIVKTSK